MSVRKLRTLPVRCIRMYLFAMDFEGAQGMVRRFYLERGYDLGDPPTAVTMAIDLFGDACLARSTSLRTESRRSEAHGRPVLTLRSDVPIARVCYLAAHDLVAPALVTACGMDAASARAWRSPLSALLCLPDEAVLEHRRDTYGQLAGRFALTSGLCALRQAEVLARPTMLVAPARWARKRGDDGDAFFPPERDREAIDAMATGKVRRLGARRAELHDEPMSPSLVWAA